jgi:hypothetical protein
VQDCTCFKSAQLPIKLVFKTAPHSIDWTGQAPLAGSAHAPAAAAAAPGEGWPDAAAAAASGTQLGSQAAAAVAGDTSPLSGSEQQQQQRPAAGRCVVIYKKGDDLRQDQFVLQVWTGKRLGVQHSACSS